jgi:hypothetical protein
MSGLGGFANAMMNVLLGWMRGVVDWVWKLVESPGTGGALAWFGKTWWLLALVMIGGGLVVDWLVWLIRWQPYHVWATRMRQIRRFFARLTHRSVETVEAYGVAGQAAAYMPQYGRGYGASAVDAYAPQQAEAWDAEDAGDAYEGIGGPDAATYEVGVDGYAARGYQADEATADAYDTRVYQAAGPRNGYAENAYAAEPAAGYGQETYDEAAYDEAADDQEVYDQEVYDQAAYDPETYDEEAYDQADYDAPNAAPSYAAQPQEDVALGDRYAETSFADDRANGQDPLAAYRRPTSTIPPGSIPDAQLRDYPGRRYDPNLLPHLPRRAEAPDPLAPYDDYLPSLDTPPARPGNRFAAPEPSVGRGAARRSRRRAAQAAETPEPAPEPEDIALPPVVEASPRRRRARAQAPGDASVAQGAWPAQETEDDWASSTDSAWDDQGQEWPDDGDAQDTFEPAPLAPPRQAAPALRPLASVLRKPSRPDQPKKRNRFAQMLDPQEGSIKGLPPLVDKRQAFREPTYPQRDNDDLWDDEP